MSCPCTGASAALDPFALDYFRGDTVGIKGAFTLDAVAYSLAGAALRFTVEDASVSPAATLWDLQLGSGITVLDAPGGIALLTPTLAQSEALSAGRTYAARLVLTDAFGSIVTTATGTLHAR